MLYSQNSSRVVAALTLYFFAAGSTGCNFDWVGDEPALDGVESALFSEPPPVAQPGAATDPALQSTTVSGTVGGGGSVGNGVYSYSIPIVVPPGRLGMQPTISLDYASTAAEGALGVGWAVSAGQSVITRCGRSHAIDGISAVINWNSSDRFCLDGQRLVVTKGTYGVRTSEYRTEMDTFARITLKSLDSGAPKVWEVAFKDGRIGTYEAAPALVREALAPDGMVTATSNEIYAWTLRKLVDRAGNRMEYTYTAGGASRGLAVLPETITYAMCDAPCTYTGRLRKVTFGYVTSLYPRDSWINGVKIEYRARLATITTAIQLDDTSTFQIARQYRLGYDLTGGTGRELLKTVRQCTGDAPNAPCLQTRFNWRESLRADYAATPVAGAPGATLIDVPNDAKRFDLYPENNFGLVDVDRDGSSDVLLKSWPRYTLDTSDQEQQARDLVLLGDGVDSFAATGLPLFAGATRSGCSGREVMDPASAQPIDILGNGRMRLVVTTLESCPFTNLGIVGFPDWNRIQPGYSALRGSANRKYRLLEWAEDNSGTVESSLAPIPTVAANWDRAEVRFADLDGDGRSDMLEGRFDQGWRWAVRMGAAEAPYSAVSFTVPVAGANPPMDGLVYRPRGVHRVVDWNGDGRQELMQADQQGTQRTLGIDPDLTTGVYQIAYRRRVVTGTGDSDKWLRDLAAPTAAPWGTPDFANGATGEGTEYAVDVNGDGLRDLLYTKPVNGKRVWRMRLNAGNGYLAEQSVGGVQSALDAYPLDLVTIDGVLRRGADNGLRIADMNGDGREDLVLLDPDPAATNPTLRTGAYHGTRGAPRIAFSTGTGFTSAFSIGPVNHGQPENAWRLYRRQELFMGKIGDIDGDGKPELVDVFGVPGHRGYDRALVTYKTTSPGTEVITSVEDERGVAENIVYDTLARGSAARGLDVLGDGGDTHTSDTLADAERRCTYPVRCISKGTAVAEYENFRAGREVHQAYRYEGARVDATGRGALGYAKVDVFDLVAGTQTTAEYKFDRATPVADKPYLHLYTRLAAPVRVTTQRYAGPAVAALAGIEEFGSGDVIPTYVRTTSFVYADAYPLRLTRSSTLASTYEVAGANETLRSERTITTNYDDYGNATKSTMVSRGVGASGGGRDSIRRTSVTTEYTNDPESWLIGLPTLITARAKTEDDANGTGCPPSEDAPCSSVLSRVKLEYTAAGVLTKRTRQDNAPDGNLSEKQETALERDAAGVITKVTRTAFVASGEAPPARVDGFRYDADGVNLIEHTNALGQKTWFKYYAKGEGNWLVGWKDQNGTPNADPALDKLDMQYLRDGFGRVRRMTTREGTVSNISYATGVTTKTVNGDGQISTIVDTRGRQVYETQSSFAGGSVIKETSYNALGGISRTRYLVSATPQAELPTTEAELRARFGSNGGNQTGAMTSDRLGRLRSIVEGVGDPTVVTYPALGTTRSIDPNGYVTTETRDQDGLLRSVARALDGNSPHDVVTTYDYDGRGLLTHVRTPDGAHEVLGYDSLGRSTTRRQYTPDRSANVLMHRLVYSGFDDVLSDGHGGSSNGATVVKYSYDALGRVTERRDNAGGNTEVQRYVWDPANGIGSIGTATSLLGDTVQVTTDYEFNAKNQRTRVRTRHGDPSAPTYDLSVRTTYDSKGRISTVQYPEYTGDVAGHPLAAALKLKYTYVNNQLSAIADASRPIDEAPLWKATARHAFGMVQTATTSSGLTTTYERNGNSLRLTAQTTASSTDPALISQSFVYQRNGMLKQRVANGWTENFKYDTLGRITGYDRNKSATTDKIVAAYAYDDAGNLTGVTTSSSNSADWPKLDESYAYGNPTLPNFATAQTIGNTATTYVPDTAGRVKQHQVGGAVTREYSYFTNDLPKQIVEGAKTTSFVYDAGGGRAKKTVTQSGASKREVIYIGDLYEQHRETATNGTLSGKVVYRVFGETGVLAEFTAPFTSSTVGALTATFVHTDHQGSPAFTTQGTAVTRTGFFPFGKRQGAAATGPASAGYTGHVQDDDLGLINMKGRIFDTVQRRFITRDPTLGNPELTGGMNPYSYVTNNPVNATDPSGFQRPTNCWDDDGCNASGMSGSFQADGYTVTWEAYPEFGWSDVSRDDVSDYLYGRADADRVANSDGGGRGVNAGGGADRARGGETSGSGVRSGDSAGGANSVVSPGDSGADGVDGSSAETAGPGYLGPGVLGTARFVAYPASGVNYVTRDAIGRVADGYTPENVMGELQRNPNKHFPFTVHSPAGRKAIEGGFDYELRNVRWPFDNGNWVHVVNVTPTTFRFETFRADNGDVHFEGPFGRIEFRTYEEEGIVYLEKAGVGPFAGINALVAPWAASNVVWPAQARSLSRTVGGNDFRYDPMGMPY